MKSLRVIYEGWGECFELGRLADDGRQVLFEYTHEAMTRGLKLSEFKLPLRSGAFGSFPEHQERLPGLLSDSLPDGWGMLLMDRLFRSRGIDDRAVSPLERLAVVGRRAMGALTYAPESEIPLKLAGVNLHTVADEIQSVTTAASEDLLRQLMLIGGSPHGARPKVLVNIEASTNQMWNTEEGSGEPWLVKFPAQTETAEVCAVEMLYSDLVRDCGIDMPQTRYFDLGARGAAFGILRFDRHNGMRVPIHTAAGAANADFRRPSLDYLNLLRLARLMTGDMREVEVLFARCVFNVVFNNRDDHPKNFSFRLEQSGQWRIAPAYDITFNQGPSGYHQMDICGEAKAPTKAHLLELAAKAGLASDRAGQIIDRTTAVAGQLSMRSMAYPISKATLLEITTAVESNRSRMR